MTKQINVSSDITVNEILNVRLIG